MDDRLQRAEELIRLGLSDEETQEVAQVTLLEVIVIRARLASGAYRRAPPTRHNKGEG